MERGGAQDNPQTVEEVFRDFKGRRAGMIKALTTANSRISLNFLEELYCLRMEQDDLQKRINAKREGFITLCLEFQKDINKGQSDEVGTLLSERDFLENEVSLLDKKNNALKNSIVAFVDEILEDLQNANSALQVEIQNRQQENEKMLKDIQDMKNVTFNSH